MSPNRGIVWLVGAGPGDPGLFTVAGQARIAEADVIVYDRLANPRLLERARPDAERIYVGKTPDHHTLTQDEINALLVERGLAGRDVVRLKGGDPFVFGRGGEEALALAGAGVPFRIVPGITAGIGGLAYAGIPATHRDTNHSVAFVTGHMAGGEVPDGIDWAALARGGQALVIYMALKHLETIAAKLMAGGLDAATPVAVVSHAATPRQRVLETALGRAAAEVAAAGMEAPAVVAVGEIVRLRAGLDWLGAMEGRLLDSDPLGRGTQRRTG